MRDINFYRKKKKAGEVNHSQLGRVIFLTVCFMLIVCAGSSLYLFYAVDQMDMTINDLNEDIEKYLPAKELADEVKSMEAYLGKVQAVLERIDLSRLNQMKALRIVSSNMPSEVGLLDYQSNGYTISYNAETVDFESVAEFVHALKTDENVESVVLNEVSKTDSEFTSEEVVRFNMEVTLLPEVRNEEN